MNVTRSQRWATLSNFLSFLRLLLAPIVVWALLERQWLAGCLVFLVGSITDLLDGYFARRLQEQTLLGQYLDPIADKVFLTASFGALAYVKLDTVALPSWFMWVVFMRELLIIGGGLILLYYSAGETMKPSLWGKWTTAGYMVVIIWLFLCFFGGWLPMKSFNVALILVASVACISLLHYYWRGLLLIRSRN